MHENSDMRRRTREGCWTCRKRKKKCDQSGEPCKNCDRLGLKCETQVRLIWEDDSRRAGMRRRGPNRLKNGAPRHPDKKGVKAFNLDQSKVAGANPTSHALNGHNKSSYNDMLESSHLRSQLVRYKQVSAYPRDLDATESLLLDHYIKRFSREYPTCAGESGPFLSVFIPLAMRSSVVLDSLLALSGAQRWDHGWASMEKESLKLRQRALKGCRELLARDNGPSVYESRENKQNGDVTALFKTSHAKVSWKIDATSAENQLYLLTSSVLFLLYEKISGEPSWRPHIEFINQFFERWRAFLTLDPSPSVDLSGPVRFLHSIFVYNDLVRSTSLRTAPLSKFYLTSMVPQGSSCGASLPGRIPIDSNPVDWVIMTPFKQRFYFPNLIARLSSGDVTVSEADIEAWDGSMKWLPSFALDITQEETSLSDIREDSPPVWDEQIIISDLYRTAANMYRLQILSGLDKHSEELQRLASLAHFLMISLPEGSVYENALLWPIGITALELTYNQSVERSSTITRLQALERRYQMRHFTKVQDLLKQHWAAQDFGGRCSDDQDCPLEQRILLG